MTTISVSELTKPQIQGGDFDNPVLLSTGKVRDHRGTLSELVLRAQSTTRATVQERNDLNASKCPHTGHSALLSLLGHYRSIMTP